MPRYVAFLRAINIGRNLVKSKDLCAAVERLGFDDVATFRASGNVIFSTDADQAIDETARELERGLQASLGFAVPVFLRTAAQVRAIAKHEPFAAELVRASTGKLQVTLLMSKPAAQVRAQVLALASDEDRLALRGSELYWLPSGGMMESTLDLKVIGQLLGMGTMRTKGTIEQIAARYFAD